jgi:uncharacterized RDD family membrane protein YckC
VKPTANTITPPSQTTRFAGFWIRVLAGCIDWVILSIVAFIIVQIILQIFVAVNGSSPILRGGMQSVIAAWYISIVISPLYSIVMECSKHQGTFGKMVVGIKVGNADGSSISGINSVGRSASKIVSSALLSTGYIVIAFTSKKQGLHDIMAGTFVFYSKERGN